MAQTTPKTSPTFAAWLRAALAEQEIPQTVLAKVTGIDASQINTYCTGKYTPKADNAWLIRKALDGSRASDQAIKRARSMRTLPMIGPAELGRKLGQR
jgi:transcriptional regulator with XRE-family HTH domain